jgi:hypothetical protein
MADRVLPGPLNDTAALREAVCIHTRKIFDSCRDKDCIEDLRVYPTISSQQYLSGAISVRPRSAELLCAKVDVDEVSFNRGYYTVDVKYFFKIKGTVFPCGAEITGLAVWDKRVMLFGSEGNAKIFTSEDSGIHCDKLGQPIAVVEAVDPILLSLKLVDAGCCDSLENELIEVPESTISMLGDGIVLGHTGRVLLATLGLFSIIKLERDTQIVIPVFNYCIPEKECVGGSEDDPCTLFGRIRFPIEEFFPPDKVETCEEYRTLIESLNQG